MNDVVAVLLDAVVVVKRDGEAAAAVSCPRIAR